MKSLIFFLSAFSFIFTVVASFQNNLLAAVCFFPSIHFILKLKKQIQAIYFTIKILRIFVFTLLNYETNILAFVLKIKQTPYSQCRTFLRALNIFLHFCFLVL